VLSPPPPHPPTRRREIRLYHYLFFDKAFGGANPACGISEAAGAAKGGVLIFLFSGTSLLTTRTAYADSVSTLLENCPSQIPCNRFQRNLNVP
jgi:hypothetical protein